MTFPMQYMKQYNMFQTTNQVYMYIYIYDYNYGLWYL